MKIPIWALQNKQRGHQFYTSLPALVHSFSSQSTSTNTLEMPNAVQAMEEIESNSCAPAHSRKELGRQQGLVESDPNKNIQYLLNPI